MRKTHKQSSGFLLPIDQAFLDAWSLAELAAEAEYLPLLGIEPTEPATGYGNIKPKEKLALGDSVLPIFEVDAFVEKPDQDTATKYLEQGSLWNSGMFVFSASVFMDILERFQPDVYEKMLSINDDNLVEHYTTLTSLSMDYGLTEKADKVAVVQVDMAWSDLGSWDSIYNRHDKSIDNNVLCGNTIITDTTNSLLCAET